MKKRIKHPIFGIKLNINSNIEKNRPEHEITNNVINKFKDFAFHSS